MSLLTAMRVYSDLLPRGTLQLADTSSCGISMISHIYMEATPSLGCSQPMTEHDLLAWGQSCPAWGCLTGLSLLLGCASVWLRLSQSSIAV